MRKVIYCLLLTVYGSLAFSCGQVGEPLPPLLKIPARVEGFQAAQFEDRVLARWTPPRLTTEGVALENLDRVVVYAVEIARDAPPAAPDALAPHFRVVAEADDGAAEVEIPVSDRYGRLTAFAVQAITTKGKVSPWSELRVLDLKQPPAAPTEMRAEASENGVQLAWTPVDGAAGYAVERASEDGDFATVAEPAAPELEDSVAFDAEYRYRVRARADSPTGAVSGAASEAVLITPKDIFPPPAPDGLRAVRTPQSVELSWAESPAADVEGYRVTLAGEPVHEGLLTAPAFSHADPPAAAASYAVVAVDRKGNASAPGVIDVD